MLSTKVYIRFTTIKEITYKISKHIQCLNRLNICDKTYIFQTLKIRIERTQLSTSNANKNCQTSVYI